MSRLFMSKDLDMLETGLFADATITCGDRTWKVHKSIICRCDWLKKAFAGGFEEAQKNHVNISVEDFSPELVGCAISFIYAGVANIEILDTNDSLVDACVRLWVFGDFLLFKELQDEAVNILEKYCDENVEKLCAMTPESEGQTAFTCSDYTILLAQLFRGIETAYTQYPHSVPCQQVLISFFYAVRATIFGNTNFTRAVSTAPPQFSHELFRATIEGRESKWTPEKLSDFRRWRRSGGCTYCKKPNETDKSYVVDPFMKERTNGFERATLVSWRCTPCFEKHAFEQVSADREKR